MRAIARRAGVSLGNAYHYFGSKEHSDSGVLSPPARRAFGGDADGPGKRDQFPGASHVSDEAQDFHARAVSRVCRRTFKTAADPHSPLNPFAHDSAPVRRDSIKLFEELVVDTRARIPPDLRAELPYLLWLYHMGVILFWIHDSSPKRARTHRLIDQTVDLLDKLISLASNPLMRPVRKRALKMVSELRELESAS